MGNTDAPSSKSRPDGCDGTSVKGVRTATARGFRDYIRLFRAVEHEGWIGDGRTRLDADHSRDTQNNMIEGANESRKDL